jgi:serine-type D-Ala-D-Ala carboxypeptidase/endopeptidase (penicillin-binding protein 4)
MKPTSAMLACAVGLLACARPAPPAVAVSTLVPVDPAPVRSDRELLRSAIDSAITAPEFANMHWGILIVDPVRGDTLYSRNAGKLFMPASNQKILTGAVALAQLGPDFRYTTVFAARGAIRGGALRGDLLVFGRGDPAVSDGMRQDAMLPLLEVADSLRARGITRIAGRLVAGGDALPGPAYGFGWGWDDFDYPYSAGVDELLFNEGITRVMVTAGARPGAPVAARTAPTTSYPALRVTAVTTPRPPEGDTARTTLITARHDSVTGGILVEGSIALGDSTEETVAHRAPNDHYLAALRQALAAKGIKLVGGRSDTTAAVDTLLVVPSPPLREILPRMEKPSQNQIAEVLFRTLGAERAGVGSADSGRAVVERQLAAWGARDGSYAVRDGSGLSRHDYVTPETVVRVLDAIRGDTAFSVFYDALPVAGVDGTIERRMRGTLAEGNVRAKTGFIDKARSLSGYVTTADGHLLLFSVLANNWTVPVRQIEAVQDMIATRLAGMLLEGAGAR